MRRSGLVMGIIIPTKPCYADRKKARVQRSYSTPSSLFTFSFCAAEGKGGLQRGKREGAQDTPCKGVQAVKNRKCEKCGAPTAEGLTLCPDCMKESGAAAEIVEAAEELRDIAQVLSITANTDTNIREAMAGILNIADRLERRK